jgi:hypothetical protein
MDLDSLDWHSFWDLASPWQGARVLAEMYGDGAAAAAAGCAAGASADDRDEDYRFWIAVLGRLRATERHLAEADAELREDTGDKP